MSRPGPPLRDPLFLPRDGLLRRNDAAIARISFFNHATRRNLTVLVDAQVLQNPAPPRSQDAGLGGAEAGDIAAAVAAVAAGSGGRSAPKGDIPITTMLEEAKKCILAADEAINMLSPPAPPLRR